MTPNMPNFNMIPLDIQDQIYHLVWKSQYNDVIDEFNTKWSMQTKNLPLFMHLNDKWCSKGPTPDHEYASENYIDDYMRDCYYECTKIIYDSDGDVETSETGYFDNMIRVDYAR